MSDEPTHHDVEANGVRLHVVEQGEGPAVLLGHGFPESWYSWRHQLPALVGPPELPKWLSEADLGFYAAEFARTGLRGGLDWYRNLDRTWELTAPWADARVGVPALFVGGTGDGVVLTNRKALDAMPRWVPRLAETVLLDGCGHWTQQERPEEVNAALLRFLAGLAA